MKAYQLKITLKDTHPPIWRRCIVPAGYSFSQLTVILVFAMGWTGYHLTSHSFHSLGVEFLEDPDEDMDPWSDMEQLEASEYVIDEYLDQVKSYTFTYDFGDDWEHQVQIEKIIEDYECNYPKVIKYKGEPPMEDCGGPWGYERLKDILKNPDDPEYDEMMEWSGGTAESEYDLEAVNEWLSKMFLKNRKAKPKQYDELMDDIMGDKSGFNRINPPEHQPLEIKPRRNDGTERLSQMFLDILKEKMEAVMKAPEDAVRDFTMMLLYLTRFRNVKSDSSRAWKNYDFAAIDYLDENDFIDKGSNGSKSVYITEKGLDYARMLLEKYGINDWESKEG